MLVELGILLGAKDIPLPSDDSARYIIYSTITFCEADFDVYSADIFTDCIIFTVFSSFLCVQNRTSIVSGVGVCPFYVCRRYMVGYEPHD